MPPRNKGRIAIPARAFTWTIDQIATMMAMDEAELRTAYLYFEGRSTGTQSGRMIARNIAQDDQPPNWRILHEHFVKWLRLKGYKYYDEGGFGG